MKKTAIFLIFFFAATFAVFSQNSKKLETPEAVGKYAFDIIKKLDNITDAEFINSLITFEEIKVHLNTLPDSTAKKPKEQIKEMVTADYEKRVTDELVKLKDKTKEANIDLSKIEFVDFTYKERSEDGFTGIRGDLVFRYKKINYEVMASAFLIDGKYIPLIIRRMSQRYEAEKKN